MRQKWAAVLMMLCGLLLVSCSRTEKGIKDALEFRTRLQEAGSCSFTAGITATVEERVFAFTLDAVYDCDGLTELSVLAPESIRGIHAELTAPDAVLSFDGAMLDFGHLDDAMTTPLYAPLVLGRSWDQAYIDCGGTDGEYYRAAYRLGYEEDELIVETWFFSGIPVRAEIYREETLLLSAVVENFTFPT